MCWSVPCLGLNLRDHDARAGQNRPDVQAVPLPCGPAQRERALGRAARNQLIEVRLGYTA